MNKTVTINISGIIFHIEEDAYDKLSKYLTTIKGYFRETEGRDEIVSDIESRIAEMLQGKVSAQKQVVLMSDVDQVIAIMGKPEEFAGEAGEEQHQTGASSSSTEQAYDGKRRRIFRDPDDKVLGGVCSGIAHYFGTDPLWLRLALGISFFVFGFGFFLYPLLWIIIPQAKTTAEKLEMKGETVNINNIHKTFTDEMDELKKRMQDLKNEASNLGTPEGKEKIRRGAGRLGSFLEEFFRMIGKIIGKFFAALFIIIGVTFLISLLASVFGYHTQNMHFGFNDSGTNMSFRELFHMFFSDEQNYLLAFIAVFLLLGIPFLMLIYHGIRIMFSLGKSNKIFRFTAAILWTSGLILSLYMGYKASEEFGEHGTSSFIQIIRPA
ncbi:MAG TPA: PspC domain-containing protein, partial [Bacteroidia bacterium]|nr:PspC domain-containing protein [Bacteroidia bacterium]